jgi:UDP-glucose 4-epimerase
MNLACGGRLTLNKLLVLLKEITGSEVEAVYAEPRPGDVRHSWADVTVSEQCLGYKTLVSLKEGLGKTVDYFRTLLKL